VNMLEQWRDVRRPARVRGNGVGSSDRTLIEVLE